jgi:molybdopterin-dependent oxidoreductase alpha subunit
MGVWEHPPSWSDALEKEFGFNVPKEPGFDTVASIRAMHEGRVKAFVALGGNFLSASPDTEYTAEALRNCNLTAHVSIKLNRSHLVPGHTALILPCLGRSEKDGGQFVTTENSMGVVQMSRGSLAPASPHLLSEVAIVARLAKATLKSKLPWDEFVADYDVIRDRIARVVPGFEDYNLKVRSPGGFYLPNLPREGDYPTASGRARFTAAPLAVMSVRSGQLVMMTIRSHDQFNTTVYGLHDRYRGLHGERRVVLMNEMDLSDRGLKTSDVVRLVSEFNGVKRVAEKFIAVKYDIPRGNCATYFPETNVLVPIDSIADGSRTPTSKWVLVTVERG